MTSQTIEVLFVVGPMDDSEYVKGKEFRTHIGMIERTVGSLKHYVIALCGRTGTMRGKASELVEGEIGCQTCRKVATTHDLLPQ